MISLLNASEMMNLEHRYEASRQHNVEDEPRHKPSVAPTESPGETIERAERRLWLFGRRGATKAR
jgi:hypothetical protein